MTYNGHKKIDNDHQLKKLLVVEQILLFNNLETL